MSAGVLRIQRQAYHRTVLANGLRILSAPRVEAESVALGIWINVGGRYESLRLNGVSHFLEHLLFKGSRRYSCRAIKEAIEGSGGVLNAFTDEEFTCLWVKVKPNDLGRAAEVLTDMVLYPELDPKELTKERAVVIEEIRMYRDLPMQTVHDLLNHLLWPNHPLGMVLSGTEKSVSRIRREDLLVFQRRFYTPRNVVIAACGRLSHRDLVEVVTRLWAKAAPGRLATCVKVRPRQKRPRFKLEAKQTEQTHLALGVHAFPRNHPQVHALNLLNVVLGGNMSSRLFQEVRERRGLAYEIGSQVKRYRDTGLFSISAGVEHRHLMRCLKVIRRQIQRLKQEGVTPKEFDQAIQFFTGQILFSSEDTVEHMFWMGESEMLLKRIEPVEAVLHQVEKVKRSELTLVSRKLLKNQGMNLAIVGPLKEGAAHRIRKWLG